MNEFKANNNPVLKDKLKDFTINFDSMTLTFEGTGNSKGVGKTYLIGHFPNENKIKYSYSGFGDILNDGKYSFMNDFTVDYIDSPRFNLAEILNELVNGRGIPKGSFFTHFQEFLHLLEITPQLLLERYDLNNTKEVLNRVIPQRIMNLEFPPIVNHELVVKYRDYLLSHN